MSRWYRAYEGTVTDAKLGEVALVAECSRSVAIAAWHCILESAAAVNDSGRFDTTARRIAVILCEPPNVIDRVLAEMSAIGMIAGDVASAWKRRQWESDSSTERSRKHRALKRNGVATLHAVAAAPKGRRETLPTTDTYTHTDTDSDSEIIDDDVSARAIVEAEFEPVFDPEALDPDGTPTFARQCAEASGVGIASPKAVATAIDLTRTWLAAGAQPDEVITAIKQHVANATEPIYSLRYFDAAVRQVVARRVNGVSPTPRRPTGKRSGWIKYDD